MRSTSSVQQWWGWSVPRRKLHFTSPALAQPKPKRKKAVKAKNDKGEDLPADFATWSRMRQARELEMRGRRTSAAASKQPQPQPHPKEDQEPEKMVEATRSAENSGEGSVRERCGGEAGATEQKANANERRGNGDRGQIAEQREPGVWVAPASSAAAGGVQGRRVHCERIEDGQSRAETSASRTLQQMEVVPGPQEVVPDEPPMPAEAQGAGAGLGDEGTAAGAGAALEGLASGDAAAEAPQVRTETPMQELGATEAVRVGAQQPSPQVRPGTPLQEPEPTEAVRVGALRPFSLPRLPPPPPPMQPPPRLQPTSSVTAAASSARQPTDKRAAVSWSLQEMLPNPEEKRLDVELDASPQPPPETTRAPPQQAQPRVWRKGGLQGEAEGRVLAKDLWRGKMAENGDHRVEEEGVQEKLPVRGRSECWAQRFCRETLGVEIPHGHNAQYRLLCPQCMGGSKAEKSLSVSVMADGHSVKWQCFRSKCGSRGSATSGAASPARGGRLAASMPGQRPREEPQLKVDTRNFRPLSQEVLDFFQRRDIGADTLKANGVQEVKEYCPATRQLETAIAFPYYRDGRLVNVKYRTLDKNFWQAKGGSQATLYGYDVALAALDEQELRGDRAKLVFVEGEMDKLTLNDQGMWNVVSVPSGAPAKVKEGPVNKQDKKFLYLMDEEREELHPMLRGVDSFLIATDNDAPGRALATELARRLGKVKCWMVKWPDSWDDHRYLAVHHSSHPQYEAAMQRQLCSQTTADPAAPDGQAAALRVEEGLPDAQRDYDARDAEAENHVGALPAGKTEYFPAEASRTGEQLAEAAGMAAQLPADSVHAQEAPEGTARGGWEEDAILADCALELMPEGDSGFRKDANEVLMKDGPMALRWFMDNAQPIPVQGLHELADYYTDVMELYNKSVAVGHSTGWPNLDAHYRVVPGELTLLTGVPNSGKSEFLDALVLNLAMQDGFSFAMASMEKSGAEHIRQLLEKYLGKPFYNKPRYAPGVPRMKVEDVVEGYKFLQEHFFMLEHGDDLVPNVDWIIDRARAAVLRYGIRGLVIDPYNELDHSRTSNKTETEFVSELLSKLKRFASLYEVHVWLVAHPRQMYDWQGEAPNLYSVSGSANFVNKADAGIVVHRNWQKMLGEKKKDRAGRYGRGREEEDVEDKPVDESLVQIRVLKMRNKAAGSVGEAWLRYDIATGRYSGADQDGEPAQPQLPSSGVLARLGTSLSTERAFSASFNQNGVSEPSSETGAAREPDAAAAVG